MSQSLEMAKTVCKALEDKKGMDIRVIDIQGISVMADYFIIAHGTNPSQIQAMVDNVQEEMHKAGYDLKAKEGYHSASWVLLDYCDVIVHIFSEEDRLFYDLERIWKDGKEVTIN